SQGLESFSYGPSKGWFSSSSLCSKVASMALVRTLIDAFEARALRVAVTPSPRTLRAELLRLCARIGYSPPLCL
ncbi:hypothetical protein, partial [Mesorhizobium sp. M7A.F.Ca.US.007.01.2.1]|uniref:hypothetical protein n=1 Tax=Mesorhizobium sp. M7A.F.Ca.US.007.01.2.1 TaxID=2496711 RepID=UPI001FE22564